MKNLVLISLCCYISFITHAQHQEDTGLQKTYVNPANGYTQVVAITTGNVKTLYISGQVGEGEDLESQVRSAFRNLEKQLQDAGATLDDLVKMTTFFVDYHPAHLETFKQVREEFLGNSNMPASTLVGVQSLALERFLVEMEAVAVVEIE